MRALALVGLCLLTVGCTGPASSSGTTDSDPTEHLEPPDSASTADTADTTAPYVYVMDGFSFVDEVLAGMPQPGRTAPLADDLAFLVDQEIALLVSLTEEPTDPLALEAVGMDLLHLPIEDFTPPTLEQQAAMVDAIVLRAAAGEKVGVHDTAGLGRCGTMLATWFVARGMEPAEAIAMIRTLRPGSIETDEQEQAVYDYAEAF